MKSRLINFFANYYPVLAILGVVAILFAANYTPGTYLTGWDNLHPEFNFPLNIRQSIFSVWQEHQGLGLLLGMQHSVALLYQLVLYALSFILPVSSLRYIFTFSMLAAGGMGAYFLIRYVLSKYSDNPKKIVAISFIGALFYLLNISTMQNFYAPFEAFIAHFAFLPWIIFASAKFLDGPSRRNTLFLCIILLISSLQAYLPTLFIVTILALGLYSAVFLFVSKSKTALKRVVLLFLFVFFINAFWLLPFIYSIFSVSGTNIDAKVNQLVTETIYLRNKEFGDFLNVSLLKGFWFKNVDYNLDGIPSVMFYPWVNFFTTPIISGFGYLLFSVILLGVLRPLRKGMLKMLPFIALFFLGFGMLGTNAFPFSTLNSILREIGIFNQIFRFPFTKFSNLTSIMFAFFLAFGILQISIYLDKKGKAVFNYLFYLVLILTIFTMSAPAFSGNLFYSKERLQIPHEYQQLFDYFQNQDPNTRIANFPQHSFWGWNFYSWGYSGSGFLWHGIHQPILDRAFDVWSPNNENYYWEISNAIYSKNPKQFEDVLNKYQVNWLFVDGNVINPPSPKSIFTPELTGMLSDLPSVTKTATFGKLQVYKVTPRQNYKNYVSLTDNLNKVNPYKWNNYDQAYSELGDYSVSAEEANLYYPFRSLLTEKEKVDVQENNNYIQFSQTVTEDINNTKLTIPSPTAGQRIIPVNIVADSTGKSIILKFVYRTPEIYIKNPDSNSAKKIWNASLEKEFLTLPSSLAFPLKVDVNGIAKFNLDKPQAGRSVVLGSGSLSVSANNIITISDSKSNSISATVNSGDVASWFSQDNSTFNLSVAKGSTFSVRVPTIRDGYQNIEVNPKDYKDQSKYPVENCENFRSGKVGVTYTPDYASLYSKNAKACLAIYSPSLDHEQGYIIFIDNKNEGGLGMDFWLLNQDENYSPITTQLTASKKKVQSVFVLSPQEKFGKAYSLHFESESIGNEATINDLGKVAMYPIPYKFLVGLTIQTQKKEPITSVNDLQVNHPNESLYVVKRNLSNLSSTLLLSQSYAPGWKLYELSSAPSWINTHFPFLFAKNNGNHLLIDNWSNGWNLSSTGETIVILYLPQYLEYIGYIITVLSLVLVLIYARKSN